jgi:hypothetical protein
VIRRAIAERERRRLARLEVKADDVVEAYRRTAFCDMRAFFDAVGRPLPIEQWPDELATCVDAVKFDERGVIREIRVDRRGALDKLARHLELLRPAESPPPPSGPVTVNMTDIYLDVLERPGTRGAATSLRTEGHDATTPTQSPKSTS